ncbi:hypothetical protein ACF06Q_08260 [Streptomyces leeuwenhoekii]|uniref:hypothetical protein n=1 Tax=Streptomyces leeuwenhoekii TaxID=1437453 RepID=UPI0037009B18
MTLPDLSLPERLLLLGADFTRHHDALTLISTTHKAPETRAAADHIPVTQALARGVLDARDAIRTAPRLYHSPDVRRAIDRMTQLATLTVIAADHLIDAVDLLSNAVFRQPGPGPATSPLGTETAKAAQHIRLTDELTSLGAEDCLAAVGVLARELHQQHPGIFPLSPALSPAQHMALEAVAAGWVALDQRRDKALVERDTGRIAITTIRSLESRGLVGREPCPLWLRDERLHLTAGGRRALAAALARPRSTPPAAIRPTARPTATHVATR